MVGSHLNTKKHRIFGVRIAVWPRLFVTYRIASAIMGSSGLGRRSYGSKKPHYCKNAATGSAKPARNPRIDESQKQSTCQQNAFRSIQATSDHSPRLTHRRSRSVSQ